eukprot:TRINITY_DN48082_c0_g1_i1.p1 TRINITY_DN48082_c0_g1~~TRINITY_DN48082_c0_g1_i1.p1  ORF type:complete len:249 (+),score=100.66 TRINITY_DN48082_c0_g1_i1:101-748(+)
MATLEVAVEDDIEMEMPQANEATDDMIEDMRRKVSEMETELKKAKLDKEGSASPPSPGTAAGDAGSVAPSSSTGASPDAAKSVYIGQVDYSTTPLELHDFFKGCGDITRVTILCDKWTGHPKGYGYIEFRDETAVDRALGLDTAAFKGRNLKVTRKRENVPGLGKRAKGGKGTKKHGKGGWRPTYGGSGGWYSGYSPYPSKGKGKGRKGKGNSWW